MGGKASTLGPATVLGPHAAKMTYVDLSKLLFRTQYGSEHEIGGPSNDPAYVEGSCDNMESGEFLYRLNGANDGYELVSNSNPRYYRGDLVPSITKNHRRQVSENCSEYVAVVYPKGCRFNLFTVTSGSKTEYYVVCECFVPDIETAAEIKFTVTPLEFKSRLDVLASMSQMLIGMLNGNPKAKDHASDRIALLQHENRRLTDQVSKQADAIKSVRSNNSTVVEKFRERIIDMETRIRTLEQNAAESQAVAEKLDKRLTKVLAKLPVSDSVANRHTKKSSAKKALGPTSSSEELVKKVDDGIDGLSAQIRSIKLEKQQLEIQIRGVDEERGRLVDKLAEKTQQAEAAEAEVARKEETLEEKLTCSICGEREKNRVFACGHPSCQECAVAWRRCFYNCTSERRDKPVKHHFPLYL